MLLLLLDGNPLWVIHNEAIVESLYWTSKHFPQSDISVFVHKLLQTHR